MNKIVLVAAALIVVIAAYFLLPQATPVSQVSFEEGYGELKGIWASGGIDISELREDDIAKLEGLSAAQINSIKSDILGFKDSLEGSSSQDAMALMDLSDVYIAFANYVASANATMALQEQANEVFGTEPCDQVSLLAEKNRLAREQLEDLRAFSDEVDSFRETYAGNNELVGLYSLEYDFDSLEEDQRVSEDAVTDLAALCV